jgi:Leucine-rich repeat (LRR) protein
MMEPLSQRLRGGPPRSAAGHPQRSRANSRTWQLATQLPGALALLMLSSAARAGQDDYKLYTSLEVALKSPAKVRRLDLSNRQLTRVPPSIGKLSNLTELSLSNNKLTALPPEIGRLTKLTSLAANNNKLKSIPPEIGALVRLDNLVLSDNELTSLPPQIGKLVKLDHLFAEGNHLTTLPAEISKLRNLDSIILLRNPIVTLPQAMGKMKLGEIILGADKITPQEKDRIQKLLPKTNVAYGP